MISADYDQRTTTLCEEFPQKSAQEIFDTALLGIRAQGWFSMDAGSCLYRGPHGLKCAAGHLLDDETALDMETRGIGALPTLTSAKLGLLKNMDLLKSLQSAHDRGLAGISPFVPKMLVSPDWVAWEMEMFQIAATAGLTYTPATGTPTPPAWTKVEQSGLPK